MCSMMESKHIVQGCQKAFSSRLILNSKAALELRLRKHQHSRRKKLTVPSGSDIKCIMLHILFITVL